MFFQYFSPTPPEAEANPIECEKYLITFFQADGENKSDLKIHSVALIKNLLSLEMREKKKITTGIKNYFIRVLKHLRWCVLTYLVSLNCIELGKNKLKNFLRNVAFNNPSAYYPTRTNS